MGQRRGTAVLLVLLVALGKAATPGGWWGLPRLGCGCWSRGGAARAGFGGSGQGQGPVLVRGVCGGMLVGALCLFSMSLPRGFSLGAPRWLCPPVLVLSLSRAGRDNQAAPHIISLSPPKTGRAGKQATGVWFACTPLRKGSLPCPGGPRREVGTVPKGL